MDWFVSARLLGHRCDPKAKTSRLQPIEDETPAAGALLSKAVARWVAENKDFFEIIWVCLKMVSTPKPNGFADHYPYEKWLFHWEYTQHFQTNPYKVLE